ncbi:MAG: hypothetical protein JRF25_11175 [Deltaproteobacteria bacterium]|nr:hypothetical protein [Deltaproteobacteria bacterium]
MEVTIRNARETDAGFLAWVMVAAGRSHVERGYWDFTFPGDEEKRLELIGKLAIAEFKSICNFEGFLVAEVDGQAAAALSGYEPKKATDFVFVEMLNEVLSKEGWGKKDLGDMFNRVGPFLTIKTRGLWNGWLRVLIIGGMAL